ncbi:hypothetical protein DsansV1_C10g0105641 [Dioscorea sansibarensis]
MKLSTRPFISGIKVPVATPGQKWRSVLLLHHHHHHLNVHMVHKPQVSFAKASSRPPETASRISTYTNDIHIRQVDQMPATPQTKAQDLEEQIERVIYWFRFMTFLGIFGSLVGSILCFLKGCRYVMDSFAEYFFSGGKVILMLVEAIDIYLIGTVMLVFGMGLYELFISNLDIAKKFYYRSNLLGLFVLPERPKWLEIKSVNELKTKVGHVIVLVLLVGLFEKSKKVAICSPIDLLCFAASILVSSGGLYLLSLLLNARNGQE